MRNRPRLAHVLIVPLLTLLVCNGLTTAVLWQVTRNHMEFLKALCVVVTVGYGLYLLWVRNPRNDHSWNLLAIGLCGATLVYLKLPVILWLIAATLLFSVMRVTLLKDYHTRFRQYGMLSLLHDYLAVLAGLAVAIFLAPASLAAAVAAFLLVQLIYEMRNSTETRSTPSLRCDRFRESLRMAEQILNSWPVSRT